MAQESFNSITGKNPTMFTQDAKNYEINKVAVEGANNIGTQHDTAITNYTSSGSIISFLKGVAQKLTDGVDFKAINKDVDSIKAYHAISADSVGSPFSHSRLASADTNLQNVKATAGKITSLSFCNNSASAKYVKMYNKASAPVIASDSALIVKRYTLQANSHFTKDFAHPPYFDTGIGYVITGAISDTDTTALTANDVSINIDYV